MSYSQSSWIIPKMIEIPSGEFLMGSTGPTEQPIHKVRVTAFAIGKYPVTFDEYDAFANSTGNILPSDATWGRNLRPVINISWHDAVAYTLWLSSQTGQHYRLPTEAEWEYAGRAGTQTYYSFGDDEQQLGDYAWFFDNSNYQTQLIGQKKPNLWGLYDMHGNVWEWVQDNWHENYEGAPVDGSAWVEAGDDPCVVRGGSWSHGPLGLRGAARGWLRPRSRSYALGFRVARTLSL